MDTSHHVLLLLMLLHCAKGFNCSCVKIIPDSSDYINVEVGTNFTAICYLQEGSGFTSNDIKWNFKGKSDKELFYLKINETSASVTVNISRDMSGWLLCEASRESLTYVPQCSHGIFLQAGYPPLKPTNLTCIAEQKNDDISPLLTCYWEPGSRDPQLKTNYTVFAKVELEQLPPYEATCIHPLAKSCTVDLSTFPLHMQLRVWVEVKNELGSERSDELELFSLNFVKPNPPLDIRVLAEGNFSTTLLVFWKHPLHGDIMKLSYAIRYCQVGSCVWTKVPENLTSAHTESYRLQSLEPYTEYVVQMRSIGERRNTYWSDWSPNATVRTPEAKPASAPDLWRISQSTSDKREITLFWKPPVKANGLIVKYHLEIIQDNQTERTVITVDMPSQPYYLEVPSGETAYIELKAINSAGVSPKATLFIPRSKYEFHGVKNMSWWVHDAKLHVKWSAVSSPVQGVQISEYLLDWVNVEERQPQWLRVAHNVTTTILTGNLTKFKRYNISVYPIYRYRYQGVWHIQSGTPVTMQAYIQQGAPTYGPTYRKPIAKKNSAVLNWNKIPETLQNGFIRNYTIFYKAGNDEQWQFKTVAGDIYSYELTGLVSESDYEVRIMASTDAGSTNSSNYNFKTMKYGDGEVEVIVVVVCLSFLFLSVFIIMLCLRKREVIKKLLWPQVPDPSDSSIAHWSPDFPVKADVPKEDVSVVEVDVFDGKSLCEEDKVVLPLKKDKYLSDEHSSGIGGSSCMSSPRHSVSDSDEGDSGQTTASTVQYSSVVASGYKGQTPSHQPPAFARSESTQPLLDCEEHSEHLSERNSYFRRGRELEAQNTDEPTFCAMQEEEMSPVVDEKPALSYMPQQSGYRPQ